jgi:hypothetical protein
MYSVMEYSCKLVLFPVVTMESQLPFPARENIDCVVAEVHEQHLRSPQQQTNGDDDTDSDWIESVPNDNNNES